MVTVRTGWALIAVVCWACGGESTSSGTGGTTGTGASSGSGGSPSGGTGGSVSGGTGGSGGSPSGGAGGSVSGGTGGTAASGGASGSGGTAASGGAAGSGGTGQVDCDPSKVLCKSMPPMCNPGEVPSVQGSCWGPCVPILQCNTVSDCSACTTGFCAGYVGWTTEYRCVMPSIQCQALACSCLAQYFCVAPYDACSSAGGGTKPAINCSCPTC